MAESTEIEMYKLLDLNERLKYEQDMLERYFNSPGKYPILYKNNEWYFEHEVKINEETEENINFVLTSVTSILMSCLIWLCVSRLSRCRSGE